MSCAAANSQITYGSSSSMGIITPPSVGLKSAVAPRRRRTRDREALESSIY